MRRVYKVSRRERTLIRDYLQDLEEDEELEFTWREEGWFFKKFILEGNKDDIDNIIWELDVIRELVGE